MEKKVYICHAPEDWHTANSVANFLLSNGIECWSTSNKSNLINIIENQKSAHRMIFDGMISLVFKKRSSNNISEIELSSDFYDINRNISCIVLIVSDDLGVCEPAIYQLRDALDLQIPVIPFKIYKGELSSALSFYLSTIHWHDASDVSLEVALAGIVNQVINVEQTGVPYHAENAVWIYYPNIPDELLLLLKKYSKHKKVINWHVQDNAVVRLNEVIFSVGVNFTREEKQNMDKNIMDDIVSGVIRAPFDARIHIPGKSDHENKDYMFKLSPILNNRKSLSWNMRYTDTDFEKWIDWVGNWDIRKHTELFRYTGGFLLNRTDLFKNPDYINLFLRAVKKRYLPELFEVLGNGEYRRHEYKRYENVYDTDEVNRLVRQYPLVDLSEIKEYDYKLTTVCCHILEDAFLSYFRCIMELTDVDIKNMNSVLDGCPVLFSRNYFIEEFDMCASLISKVDTIDGASKRRLGYSDYFMIQVANFIVRYTLVTIVLSRLELFSVKHSQHLTNSNRFVCDTLVSRVGLS